MLQNMIKLTIIGFSFSSKFKYSVVIAEYLITFLLTENDITFYFRLFK